MESTSGPSPTTTRPPRLARRIRSRPSRRGRPGATMASASLMAAFWRVVTRESYLAPSGRPGGRRSPGRARRGSRTGPRPRPPCRPGSARCRVGRRGPMPGTTTRPKPSRAASSSRRGRLVTWRTSPASPTSPTAARSAGRATPVAAEATARATARSAAGSVTRIPPATEAKTSTACMGRPAWRASTARVMTRRPLSSPTTDRFGWAWPMGATRAWSSTIRVRRPCRAGSTTPPGTPVRRSPSSRRPGSSTRLSPWSPISNRPSSPVGPKRCLTASSRRRAW